MLKRKNPSLKVTDESNGLHVEDLSPKLQEFVREGKIINRLGQDFCCKDFPELGDSSFRQKIYKLRKLGWIVTTCRGWFSYYRIKGEYTGWERKDLTHEGMGVGTNMKNIINEASKKIPSIHDIKIEFKSEKTYQNAIKVGKIPNPKNKGIFEDKLWVSGHTYAKIAIYPKKVVIDIACTYYPIIYDFKGALKLIKSVTVIEDYLIIHYHPRDMPNNLDWVVTHYHLNQDGQTEFSGTPYHRTISDFTGGFIREYSKRFSDASTRERKERIITPETTVRNLANDMNNLGNYLYSDKEDLSKIMPSQILAYNRLGTIIQKQASLYNPTHYGVYSL